MSPRQRLDGERLLVGLVNAASGAYAALYVLVLAAQVAVVC